MRWVVDLPHTYRIAIDDVGMGDETRSEAISADQRTICVLSCGPDASRSNTRLGAQLAEVQAWCGFGAARWSNTGDLDNTAELAEREV